MTIDTLDKSIWVIGLCSIGNMSIFDPLPMNANIPDAFWSSFSTHSSSNSSVCQPGAIARMWSSTETRFKRSLAARLDLENIDTHGLYE